MKKVKEKEVKSIEPFKPKMRISLLDKNLIKIEDRLVAMDTEMLNGPKEKHKGPLSLEVTLRDKDDVQSFKDYLDKLIGDLPISERKPRASVKKVSTILDEEPLKELIKDIKLKCKSLDELVKYLRDKGFVFVTKEFLEDIEVPIKLKEIDLGKEFMIRKIKEAKNPKNDRFDPQLVLSLKFMGIKKGGVRIYLYNEPYEKLDLQWDKKSSINFKKLNLTKFPPYMIKEEREKYRQEERKYQLNPDLEKSKFWLRWYPAVEQFNQRPTENAGA